MAKTFIFPSFKTNTSGVWFFSTDKEKEFKHKKPCKGFGQIKYDEGSVYTGDIFFDGLNFHKLGYGQQDFSNSTLGEIDEIIGEKIYKFVGFFDYRKTNWIYGNGVMYYKDKNDCLGHFIKGFYRGLIRIKDYVGEFDYSTLIEGYTKENELFYSPRDLLFINEKSKLSDVKTLFVGDSYFEFWNYTEYSKKTFYECFKDALNVGLGGSTFLDWIPFIDKLQDVRNVRNIIINLGFNDIHSGFSYNAVYRHYLKVLRLLREYFPNAKYYLVNVVHAPNYESYLNEEKLYNELISKTSEKHNVKILDNYTCIKDVGEKENCFHSDKVHLNSKGYEIFYNLIVKEVDL